MSEKVKQSNLTDYYQYSFFITFPDECAIKNGAKVRVLGPITFPNYNTDVHYVLESLRVLFFFAMRKIVNFPFIS